MITKKGLRSTEFYFSCAVAFLGVAVAGGWITEEQKQAATDILHRLIDAGLQAGGLVVALLAALGYGKRRTELKQKESEAQIKKEEILLEREKTRQLHIRAQANKNG